MDSSVSPKDEIWFLRVCHHISNTVLLAFSSVGSKGSSPKGLVTNGEADHLTPSIAFIKYE